MGEAKAEHGIFPGCWVNTRFSSFYGPAVCVAVSAAPRVSNGDGLGDGHHVAFRYRAKRCSDGATIWVGNGDYTEGDGAVTLLRGPTKLSKRVLKLTGPYGDGDPAL